MATYYCSGQNGNDSNNGTTVALARKTIDSALSLLSAGDTLYIGPATYREQLINSDFTAGSDVGSETKHIGDPDSNIFTNDIPGPVRITAKDIHEKSQLGTIQGSVYYTIGINRNHIHFHNLYIEGPATAAHNASGTSTAYNTYGIYMSTSTHNYKCMWFDCIINGGQYAVRGSNGTSHLDNTMTFVRCFLVAGLYGAYYANFIHCISMARYNYLYGNAHGCIALGGQYGFLNMASSAHPTGGSSNYYGGVTNCLAMGSYYGFYRASGCNNAAIANTYCWWDNAQNLKPNGLWLGWGYRANRDGEETHPYNNIYTSQNSVNDYSSDGMTTTTGAGIIFNPNIWYDLVKAFKPYDGFTIDGTNNVTTHGMQGWFSGSLDPFFPTTGSLIAFGQGESNINTSQLTGSFDIEGNPYKSSDNITTVGPYTFTSSSLNFSTISGSNPSIEIGGFGSKIFDIPVSASTSITASVAVKYNSGTVPRLEIKTSGAGFGLGGISSGSITEQVISATGTGDQTSAYQTLTAKSTVNINDKIQLKLVQPDDDNSSFAIFSQLKVEDNE